MHSEHLWPENLLLSLGQDSEEQITRIPYSWLLTPGRPNASGQEGISVQRWDSPLVVVLVTHNLRDLKFPFMVSWPQK